MTEKISLLNDLDLCIGCLACETACKQEHNLPVNTKWMNVIRVGPEEIDGKLVMDFVPMHCRHCENPPCMQACPVDAITKRPDGIVLFRETVCIGCKQCIETCPFGAAQYNPEVQRAQACNLCCERLDQGLLPACAQNCPTGALILGPPADYVRRKREKQARTFLHRRFPDSQGPI